MIRKIHNNLSDGPEKFLFARSIMEITARMNGTDKIKMIRDSFKCITLIYMSD
jgi:hypothetical protein